MECSLVYRLMTWGEEALGSAEKCSENSYDWALLYSFVIFILLYETSQTQPQLSA